MSPTIRLTSKTDSILFTGTDVGSGWIYDNEALSSWMKLPGVRANFHNRANGHGTFRPDRLYLESAKLDLPGQYFGIDAVDSELARRRLTGMFSEGRSVTMEVTTDLGIERREVYLLDGTPEWTPYNHFEFDLALEAPDPRRYGPAVNDMTSLPSPSSGLTWPLGSSPSGLYFDWGTPGTLGQIAYTNLGNAESYPTLFVTGGLEVGFRVTELETGRELAIVGGVSEAQTVELNSRTRRAKIGASDVTGRMTSREWFTLPPGETRRYQFATLGGTSGTPSLKLTAAPAYL